MGKRLFINDKYMRGVNRMMMIDWKIWIRIVSEDVR